MVIGVDVGSAPNVIRDELMHVLLVGAWYGLRFNLIFGSDASSFDSANHCLFYNGTTSRFALFICVFPTFLATQVGLINFYHSGE